jgi:hypothetical protein
MLLGVTFSSGACVSSGLGRSDREANALRGIHQVHHTPVEGRTHFTRDIQQRLTLMFYKVVAFFGLV